MKIEVNISKSKFFAILVCFVILFGVFLVAAIWEDPLSGKWHESGEVKVNVGGANYSLQEAIDQGLIGGTGSSKIVFIPPVQIAFDEVVNSIEDKEVDTSAYISSNAKGVIIDNFMPLDGRIMYFVKIAPLSYSGSIFIVGPKRSQVFVPFVDNKIIKYRFESFVRSNNTINLVGYYE